MIVQCNRCLTRFKISDEKVRGKVVRIRCAKCHQPFTVQGEKTEDASPATVSENAANANEDSQASEGIDSAPAGNADGGVTFSLNDNDDDLNAGLAEGNSTGNTEEPAAGTGGGLSIGSALGEEEPPPPTEELTAQPTPSVEEETTGQELSMELSTELQTSPPSINESEDEFTPEPAPPEEIIEDDDDSGELDLGIGPGIVTATDDNDNDNDKTDSISIENTLEDSGFGFSAEDSEPDDEKPDFDFEDAHQDDDFTKDIDEFPEMTETEELEFGEGLPDFDGKVSEPLEAAPDSLTPDPAETAPDETATDDLGLTTSSEPEEEVFKGFAEELSPETSEDIEVSDDESLLEPAAGPEEEVFKGFTEEPSPPDSEGLQDPAPYDTGDGGEEQDPEPLPESLIEESPSEQSPEEEEELAQAGDPQANHNDPEPPLLFETPASPKPNITYTPAPPAGDAPELSATGTYQADAPVQKRSGSSKWLRLVILAVVIYGGIGLLYTGGIIGSPQSARAKLSPIRVERIRGVFIENKEMGRIFAIEGRIRNFSEEPQGIKMIRGVLENNQGHVVAAKKVTPGKIIPKETLKTITRAKLLQQLSGVSGGSIPPKGSIPVMIVFTKLPNGFTRAGVEVFRK